jgi:hypothetical protein
LIWVTYDLRSGRDEALLGTLGDGSRSDGLAVGSGGSLAGRGWLTIIIVIIIIVVVVVIVVVIITRACRRSSSCSCSSSLTRHSRARSNTLAKSTNTGKNLKTGLDPTARSHTADGSVLDHGRGRALAFVVVCGALCIGHCCRVDA